MVLNLIRLLKKPKKFDSASVKNKKALLFFSAFVPGTGQTKKFDSASVKNKKPFFSSALLYPEPVKQKSLTPIP